MNTNTNKKVLSVEERLDRLERLVVKALVSIPLPDPTRNQMVDITRLPIVEQAALRERYFDNPTALVEQEYAVESVRAICVDSIATTQRQWDEEKVRNDAIENEKKRTEAEAAKRAADEAARIAQEEIDALTPAPVESDK